MTTENALAGDSETVSAPVTEVSPTAPATEQAQIDAQTTDAQKAEGAEKSPGKSDAAENTDKGKTEEPRRSRAQERIDQLTRAKHDAERRAEALAREVDRLRKPIALKADATEDERVAHSNRTAVRDEMREQAEANAASAAQQAHTTRKQIFEAKVSTASQRSPDALAKFYSVPCSSVMADFLAESDKAGELAVHLGSNPDEATRIAELPPTRQAIELARLEGRLSAPAEVRRVSQAPTPAATRLAGGASPPGFQPDKASAGDIQEMLRKKGLLS